jgi:hypothetical protein
MSRWTEKIFNAEFVGETKRMIQILSLLLVNAKEQ